MLQQGRHPRVTKRRPPLRRGDRERQAGAGSSRQGQGQAVPRQVGPPEAVLGGTSEAARGTQAPGQPGHTSRHGASGNVAHGMGGREVHGVTFMPTGTLGVYTVHITVTAIVCVTGTGAGTIPISITITITATITCLEP